MKTKTTRKALLMSVVSMLLCVSMLVGSTFAWFTDSVTSTNNVIVAGNLDVELYYQNDETADWTAVTSASNVFKTGTLWEPGHVEVIKLKVVNEGTLALKYQLGVNIANEIGSINIEGNPFKLSDHIKFGFFEGEQNYTREQAVAAVDATAKAIKNAYNTEVIDLLPLSATNTDNNDIVTMVVYMPETVGNVANYGKGQTVPKIDLGINLLATQYTYEEDSFDNTYDKDAEMLPAWDGTVGELPAEENGVITINTAGELAAFANAVNGTTYSLRAANNTFKGKTVVLGSDINLSGVEWTPIGLTGDSAGFQGTFDGRGYTIYNLNVNLSTRAYQSAGLFGSISGATIKNLNLVDANVYSLDDAGNTSNGNAVLVGSSQFASTIENVTVKNSTVTANRRVSAIAGYFVGTISECTVENTTLTAIFDDLGNGSYDNADKVGAIIAYSNGASLIKNNTVNGVTLTGYRDIGGIAGYATTSTITGNVISDSYVVIDNAHNYKGYTTDDQHDANMIVGEGTADDNTATDVAVQKREELADGLEKVVGANEYFVSNANGLAHLNTMMANSTAGKNAIVNITDDIDFAGKTWTTVDSHADSNFYLGELNGNGHTVSNLTVNGQAMFRRFAGFGDVTVKDITFANATVNSGSINTAIITGHTYQNVTLDNVDVVDSSVTGGYKVGTLIGTVYNENSASTVTATLKNCDVSNVVVTATSYDFCTTGMVAFVYADDADKIEFENCTVSDVKLYAPNVYSAHAAIYTTDSDTLFNEAEGVTVTNVTFENK